MNTFRSQSALIVEDDPFSAKLLRVVLDSVGCQVRCAGSAEAALDSFESMQPDIIVIDLGLPGMNGLSLLHRIREFPFKRKPVAVVVSANNDPELRKFIFAAGCRGYFNKPINVSYFINQLSWLGVLTNE